MEIKRWLDSNESKDVRDELLNLYDLMPVNSNFDEVSKEDFCEIPDRQRNERAPKQRDMSLLESRFRITGAPPPKQSRPLSDQELESEDGGEFGGDGA